jgi:hypothetical protein
MFVLLIAWFMGTDGDKPYVLDSDTFCACCFRFVENGRIAGINGDVFKPVEGIHFFSPEVV